MSEIDITLIKIENRQRSEHSVEHLEGLAWSVEKYGLLNPPMLRRDYVLVHGEGRVRAVRDYLKRETIEVRFTDEVDESTLYEMELEENGRRANLPWQDMCKSIQKLHSTLMKKRPGWSQEKTGALYSYTQAHISQLIKIDLEDPRVAEAKNATTAYNKTLRIERRALGDVINNLYPVPASDDPQEGVVVADFNQWAPSYTGVKYTLLHVDFPYGINAHQHKGQNSSNAVEYMDTEETWQKLCETFVTNLHRFCAPMAQMIFWFHPKRYCEVRGMLDPLPGWKFEEYPLIWDRGNEGIASRPGYGSRRTYEMAFFGWRGRLPLTASGTRVALFKAPTYRETHEHEKAEDALHHWFAMCVDEDTRLLDPTCGSGSALRAAKRHGAKQVLGLELDPNKAELASRALRDAERDAERQSAARRLLDAKESGDAPPLPLQV